MDEAAATLNSTTATQEQKDRFHNGALSKASAADKPPVTWSSDMEHQVRARPMCTTHFRERRPSTATPLVSSRPCTVLGCENQAAYWVIDTE